MQLSPREALELEEIAKSLALDRLKLSLAQEQELIKLRSKIDRVRHQINHLASKHRGCKSWLRGGRTVLLTVLVFTTITLTATGVMMDEDPFEILQRFGLATAKNSLPEKPRTLDDVYKQSWMAFLEGEHERASHGAYSILAENEIPAHLEGNCHYLLGAIQSHTGQFQKAIGRFLEAYDAFSVDQDDPNQFLIAVEIANSLVALNRYRETEAWLDTAWNHFQRDQIAKKTIHDLGQYYLVRLDLAVAREENTEALVFAKSRMEEATKTGNRALLPYALQQVGFWYAANGCTEMAAYYTDLANGAVLSTGDDRPLAFNIVNSLLIQRSLGYSVKPASVAAIRAWAKKRKDHRLEYVLDLAQTITIKATGFDCDSEPYTSDEKYLLSH